LARLETEQEENSSVRRDLDKELKNKEVERLEKSKELDQARGSSRRGVVLAASKFTEFHWPYMLAILLGLKLARHNYLAGTYDPTTLAPAKRWILVMLGFASAWLRFRLRRLLRSPRPLQGPGPDGEISAGLVERTGTLDGGLR
jgi:hypothetical protein